ncbi:hypothetical protein [Cellulosimicrobium sp. CpK407]|uniref:hypothetical protein n=1 Tax=Cellulosimicrobium sp. CpK407 TaxID=3229847 RepID=UPI003F354EEB
MSTPALARATEATREHDPARMDCLDHDGYCCPTGDAHDMGGAHAARAHQAHATVSAALHDPDDPDWLKRVLADAVGDGEDFRAGHPGIVAEYTAQADAVRAAILAEVE